MEYVCRFAAGVTPCCLCMYVSAFSNAQWLMKFVILFHSLRSVGCARLVNVSCFGWLLANWIASNTAE